MKGKICDNILKYKAELMGGAICLIMCFHSIYTIHNIFFTFIKNICDIGVDVFMFLSGFSLAFSYYKDNNIGHFYKKRALRILPTYFFIFFFVYVYNDIIKGDGNFYNVFYDLFFLNFFIDGNIFIWFIPVILVYYFITPFYINLIKIYKILYYIPYLIIIILALCIIYNIRLFSGFLWLRLPIYLLGINMFIKKDYRFSICILLLYCLVCFVGCYYCININHSLFGLKYILYIPIVMLIIICYKSFRWMSIILSFLGGITLEVYLLHERIQWLLDNYINNQFLLCLFSITITIVLSYIIKKIITKFDKTICKIH